MFVVLSPAKKVCVCYLSRKVNLFFISLDHVFYGYQITVSVMKRDQTSDITKSETGTRRPGSPQGAAEHAEPLAFSLWCLVSPPKWSHFFLPFPPLYLTMCLDSFPALSNHGWKQFLFKVG